MGNAGWSINGINLQQGIGSWWVVSGTMVRPPVSVRRTSVVVPGVSGSIPVGPVIFDEPTVGLKIAVASATPSEDLIEERTNALMALLASPDIVLGRRAGWLYAEAPARLEGVSIDDAHPGGWTFVTATFAIPGVFLRGVDLHEQTIAAGEGQECVEFSGTSGRITDALIRVNGADGNVRITDVGTGTDIRSSASGTLYVDLGALTAWTGGDWNGGGEDVSHTLDWGLNGPLVLSPVTTGSDARWRPIKVSAEGGSSFTIRARKAYL